jgi:hypothetical protein
MGKLFDFIYDNKINDEIVVRPSIRKFLINFSLFALLPTIIFIVLDTHGNQALTHQLLLSSLSSARYAKAFLSITVLFPKNLLDIFFYLLIIRAV